MAQVERCCQASKVQAKRKQECKFKAIAWGDSSEKSSSASGSVRKSVCQGERDRPPDVLWLSLPMAERKKASAGVAVCMLAATRMGRKDVVAACPVAHSAAGPARLSSAGPACACTCSALQRRARTCERAGQGGRSHFCTTTGRQGAQPCLHSHASRVCSQEEQQMGKSQSAPAAPMRGVRSHLQVQQFH